MKKTLYIVPLMLGLVFTSSLSAQNVNEGRRLTRNEQYEDAGNVFNNLISAKPKVGDAYYYGGINDLQRGDTLAAAAIFDKGLLNSPKFTLTNVGKGHLLLRQGKVAEAELLFAIALKAKKKSKLLAYKEVARAYLMVTEGSRIRLVSYATKALEYLNSADNLEDNEVQLLIGDAYAIISPMDLGRAVEQYQISSSKNAKDPLPRLREALVYQKAKNFETAMERINQAIALDVDFAPAYRQKAELFADMGSVETKLNQKKLFRDSAVMFYREYLKRNNNLSARRMFVQSLFVNQEYDECIKEGLKLQGEKEYPNIWGVLAYAIVQKNDTSSALNQNGLGYFEKYEEKHVKPRNRGLSAAEMYYKSILLFRTGSKAASFGLMSKALSDTANTNAAWYDIGFDLFYKSGNYTEALKIIELKETKVGKLYSKDMYYKAQCMTQLGRYSDAIATFKEIIGRDTTYTRGYYYIAQNWRKLDAKDSTGNLSIAYLDWFKHMTADDKIKYKRDIEYAYRDMGYYTYNKASKLYVSLEDKAAGYAGSKALYNQAIEYYKKVLELVPDDSAVKTQIAETEKFVANIGKKRAPLRK